MATGTLKRDILSVETTTIDQQTCEAGGGHFYSANISKTGKTPISICGINIDNATSGGGRANWLAMWGFNLSGTTASVALHNYANGEAVFKVTFSVLYKNA